MGRRTGTIRIGTSGWQYDHWRGVLYPPDLPTPQWFSTYAAHFGVVEVNNTFYRLPRPEVFDAWRAQADGRFRYALKYSRFGSHMKKLKDPEGHVELFMSRAARLGRLLGPILVQLPPGWKADPARLAAFLAVATARHRRWVLEFRERDWLSDEVFALLHRFGVALCVHDMLADHPRLATTSWTYLRYHGGATGDYPATYLATEAERIVGQAAAGLDVWAFFNNDGGGCAVRNALELARRVAAVAPPR